MGQCSNDYFHKEMRRQKRMRSVERIFFYIISFFTALLVELCIYLYVFE